MGDSFEQRLFQPMLIKSMHTPFDSPNWIYEIKWDGIRCLAYLGEQTDLINKRGKSLLLHVPELSAMHSYVRHKCVLDGELLILKNGAPDFFEIQARALMSNAGKIAVRSNLYPATFIAYDILYMNGNETLGQTQMQRKELLEQVIKEENDRFALSRYRENEGIKLFEMTKEMQLEGVVAKKKDSKYYCGKRTDDWYKFKNMTDEDYVICGYVPKSSNMISFILGQYDIQGNLIYRGHVTLGASLNLIRQYNSLISTDTPFEYRPSGHEDAVWFRPELVGVVQYMANDNGSLRQPVFKGVRDDVRPEECIYHKKEQKSPGAN